MMYNVITDRNTPRQILGENIMSRNERPMGMSYNAIRPLLRDRALQERFLEAIANGDLSGNDATMIRGMIKEARAQADQT